jgi:hypothetical protein
MPRISISFVSRRMWLWSGRNCGFREVDVTLSLAQKEPGECGKRNDDCVETRSFSQIPTYKTLLTDERCSAKRRFTLVTIRRYGDRDGNLPDAGCRTTSSFLLSTLPMLLF